MVFLKRLIDPITESVYYVVFEQGHFDKPMVVIEEHSLAKDLKDIIMENPSLVERIFTNSKSWWGDKTEIRLELVFPREFFNDVIEMDDKEIVDILVEAVKKKRSEK